MKSRFTKKWVCITLNGSDGHFKAYVEKVGLEANQEAYYVRYEDGQKEIIFLSSVFRIWSASDNKATVVDIKKYKEKKFKLIK